jgi:DNA repair photolyase
MIEINPEKAIRYIQEHAEKYAKAKGEVAFTDNYLKVVKAQEANKSKSTTIGGKDTDAYASPEYLLAILANKQAIEEESHLRWMLEAAKARIEVWKTQEYSKRSEMRNLS